MPIALPQSVKKLLQDKAYGHVVTFNAQGKPQLTMVWMDVDGNEVLFNTADGRPVAARHESGERGRSVEVHVRQVHRHAQRAQTLGARQLVELQLLDLTGQVAEPLQVLDVLAPLLRLARVRVDQRDLPGLGQ